MTAQEREEYMVDKYGECVTRARAVEILGRSRQSIYRMLEDGRLESVCGGDMVCTHSIARYISSPKEADRDARERRKSRNWHVT